MTTTATATTVEAPSTRDKEILKTQSTAAMGGSVGNLELPMETEEDTAALGMLALLAYWGEELASGPPGSRTMHDLGRADCADTEKTLGDEELLEDVPPTPVHGRHGSTLEGTLALLAHWGADLTEGPPGFTILGGYPRQGKRETTPPRWETLGDADNGWTAAFAGLFPQRRVHDAQRDAPAEAVEYPGFDDSDGVPSGEQ